MPMVSFPVAVARRRNGPQGHAVRTVATARDGYRGTLWLGIALILLTITGCAPRYIQGSPGEVQKSMAACADIRIDGQTVPRFMTGRTAFVLDAAQARLTKTSPTLGEIELKEKTPIEFGTATAIDPRGYFLTAAHCLGKKPPYLGFFSQGKLQFEPCRVVWRSAAEQPDLALLYVPFPLKVFAWSPDVPGGAEVLGGGLYNGESADGADALCHGKDSDH